MAAGNGGRHRIDRSVEVTGDVTMLALSGGGTAHGTVVRWSGDHGTVRVPRADARQLDGLRVGVTSRGEQAWLHLHEATARRPVPAGDQAQRGDELVLTDAVSVADEGRRGALRASVEHWVLLVQEGTRTRRTVTLDLSSTGCRVRRLPEHRLRLGHRVRAALVVDAGPTVWADTEVVRVDEQAQELALRFLNVAEADRDRLDRDVLAYLTATRAAAPERG